MSLMIMGVGLVTVATLFPMALLRAVQATHLTQSAVVVYNARNTLYLHRDTIETNIRGQNTSVVVFDPLGWHRMAAANASGSHQWVFSDGDGNINPNNPSFPSDGIPVDPDARDAGELRRLPYFFDFNRDGGYTEQDAWAMVTAPDSYIDAFDRTTVALPATSTDPVTSVQLAEVVATELSQIPFRTWSAGSSTTPASFTGVRSQITLFNSFDLKGRTSVTREITWIDRASGEIFWTEDINGNGTGDPGEDFNGNGFLDTYALDPAEFPIGEVRLETQDERYTWMLTCRAGASHGDIVVFYNRRFTPEDEQRYAAVFRNGQHNVDLAAGVDPPGLKQGGFVFDALNGYWYRIQEITENPATGGLTLVLDTTAKAGTSGGIPSAVFMQGVIDHYGYDFRTNENYDPQF